MNPHKLYVTTCKMSPLTNEHASGEDQSTRDKTNAK